MAPEMKTTDTRDSTAALERCIEHCSTCHDVCLRMASGHCLERGGEHVRPAHVTLMLDCADICRTAADFMVRGSPRHVFVCSLCADVCESCAQDCERLGDMQACVDACRACADSCRETSGDRDTE
ncbi:four-helix bundle copper-binding protein [Congregicoccus parvus]|uniref:four-helix bundle copper-binding protein n=1 Tax=Congregicoccus parvus TaxID=3081749 RepID=UPI003FA581F9